MPVSQNIKNAVPQSAILLKNLVNLEKNNQYSQNTQIADTTAQNFMLLQFILKYIQNFLQLCSLFENTFIYIQKFIKQILVR